MRQTYTFFLLLFFMIVGNAQEAYEVGKLMLKNDSLKAIAKESYKSSAEELSHKFKGEKFRFLKNECDEREEYFMRLLEDGSLIQSGSLYKYTKEVLDKVTKSSNITENRSLFLVRDFSANAFNMGDNNVFVNIGLLYAVDNEDQLAFVLAHELGHNELHHFDHRIEDYANVLLSDSLKKRQQEIKRSAYLRVSKMNELMLPWLLASKEKSREAEKSADDFSIEVITNAGYNLNLALPIFQIFEKKTIEKDSLNFSIERLLKLDELPSDYSDQLFYEYSSSLGSFQMQKDTLEDLLRTHPFGSEREDELIAKIPAEMDGVDEKAAEKKYEPIKRIATREMIANSIFSDRLDIALYTALRFYIKYKTDVFVNKSIPFCFMYLGYEKKKRRSGKYIAVNNGKYSNMFNEFIFFLREISPEKCYEIALYWMDHHNDNNNNEMFQGALAVYDIVQKKYDDFEIRYELEKEKQEEWYIFNVLKKLKEQDID